MRQGTSLESIKLLQEYRRMQRQQQFQNDTQDLSRLPVDYIQVIIKNEDGTYSVA